MKSSIASDRAGASSLPGSALILLGHAARFILAAVFLFAAVTKIFDPAQFAEIIRGYELTPASWATWQAPFFIVIEIALAAALIVNYRPRLTLPATIGLLTFFIVVIAIAMSRGYDGSCGCFGSASSRTPLDTIVEDIGFIALAVIAWLAFARKPGHGRAAWQLTATMLGIGIALFGVIIGPTLPLPPFATNSKPGAPFDHIVIEEYPGRPDEGRKVFALMNPTADRSIDAVPALNALAAAPDVPEVVGVFEGDNRDMVTFLFDFGPEFDAMGHAPRAAVRPYYRRLPVVLAVENGIIRGAWHEKVPSPAEVSAVFN